MQVNDYNSFFEIFAGLNLAYATSDWFKSGVDKKIGKLKEIRKTSENKIKDFRDEITVLTSVEYDVKQIEDNLEEIERYFDKLVEIEEDENNFEKIKVGYRSIFLMTSLYCFTILLLGGFEQFFQTPKTWLNISTQHILSNTFLFILHSIFIYNIFIFTRSCLKEPRCYKDTKPYITTLIMAFCVFMAIIWCSLLPFEIFFFKNGIDSYFDYYFFSLLGSKLNILLALFIGVSPYLLHFLRVYVHEVSYSRKIIKYNTDLEHMLGQVKTLVESLSLKNTIVAPKPELDKKFKEFCDSVKEGVLIWWKALKREV